MRYGTHLAKFIVPFKDFFFPPICFSCNNRLTETESRVCTACWQLIRRVKPDDYTVGILRDRFSAEGSVDAFYSCYYFEERGVFQKIVHSLKYDAITLFGVELGRHVGLLMKEQSTVQSIDMILPIPLHNVKSRERGYNQSDYICRGISDVLTRPYDFSLVQRQKNTVSQTHLNADERRKNVGDAFEIRSGREEFVRGKVFLVVDDVITTGSTIQALARILKDAGAAKVVAASAALAMLGSKDSGL